MRRARRPGRSGVAAPWLRGVSGGLVLAALALAGPASAQLVTDPGTVVRTIRAWQWNPPASDAAGFSYRPDTGERLTCDSEVDESIDGISHYQGVNVWTHALTGEVVGGTTTVPWSNEPTGISFDPAGGRLWSSTTRSGTRC